MPLPKSLTTVTTFSKLLAMFLFILFPFLGFYAGMQYQKMTTPQSENIYTSQIEKPSPTPAEIYLTEKEIRNDLGFGPEYKISITHTYENYAGVSVKALNSTGYGIFAKKENGTWTEVWRGQNTPFCSEMQKNNIPKELYGECQKGY